jgi:regulatory protein
LISRQRSNSRASGARSAAPASPFDLALRFLAQRPRSEHEVRQRLRRASVDEAAIEAVVVRLREHGVVDDAEFAQYWLEQRQTFKPRGARLVKAELRQHGIDATAAAAVVETMAPSAAEDAYRAGAKRARTLSRADERTFKSRLAQFLGRRGFDWETISPAVERLWAESGGAPEPDDDGTAQ